MLKQLRIKFVAVTMSFIAVLLCVIMAMIYVFTAVGLNQNVTIIMQSISENMSRNGVPSDQAQFDERLHYFVLSKSGSGELTAIGSDTFDLTDTERLEHLYQQVVLSSDDSGFLPDDALKYMVIPDTNDSVLFVDVSAKLAGLHTLKHNCIIVGLLALLVFTILTILHANFIIRPVEIAWKQQKQFIADASHELKTPLTVIKTNTEMLASPQYSDTQKMRFIENTAEMTKRMQYLIEGMLDLARVDSGLVQASFTQLNYSDLTELCLLPFEPLFFESGRSLEYDIVPNICLKGSESHLRQITEILLDNALKYSHPNTVVQLSLSCSPKHALLCVDSCGAPISQTDLKNIFNRFYSTDHARTGNSYGLGLSIAFAIVQEHKGTIWAESKNGHNRFFVKLPL